MGSPAESFPASSMTVQKSAIYVEENQSHVDQLFNSGLFFNVFSGPGWVNTLDIVGYYGSIETIFFRRCAT
jgi:hypothetical protein